MFDQFPVALPNRACRPPALIRVMRLVPEERPRRRNERACLCEQWQDVLEIAGRWRGYSGEVAQRGREVPKSHWSRDHETRCAPCGKASNEWHADATFEQKSLARSKRGVERGRWVVSLRHMQSTIIRGKDNQCVGDQAAAFKGVEDSPDSRIKRLDHGCIAWMKRLGVCVDQFLRSRQRDVWIVKRDIEEKWFVRVRIGMRLNPLHGGSRLSEFAFAPVYRFRARIGLARKIAVKSMVSGAVTGVSQMPFADTRTPITDGFEKIGQSLDAIRQVLIDDRRQQSMRTAVNAAGQERSQTEPR